MIWSRRNPIPPSAQRIPVRTRVTLSSATHLAPFTRRITRTIPPIISSLLCAPQRNANHHATSSSSSSSSFSSPLFAQHRTSLSTSRTPSSPSDSTSFLALSPSNLPVLPSSTAQCTLLLDVPSSSSSPSLLPSLLSSLSLSYPPLLFKTFCILLATILLTFLHRIPMHIGLLAPLPLPPHQLHCLPHRPSFYPQMLLTAETLTAVTTAIVFAACPPGKILWAT